MLTRELTAHDLLLTYIYFDPRKPGLDEARLTTRGISVWAIIGYLEGVDGDIERTASDYEIPVDAVRAAIVYYRRHPEVIDNRLLANEWPDEVIHGDFPPRPERLIPAWDSP